MTGFKQRKATTKGRKLGGMKLIRGGTFRMGCDDFYDDEKPVRTATVGDFWIDETSVTNAQFARFVAETGHVTLAELAPDPSFYPRMDPAMAQPGSAVFTPPDEEASTEQPTWWSFVFGARWNAPLGPGSSLEGLDDHPVVHVSHSDAAAYAAWARKQLPTEPEWEYAARGGLDGATYAWGEEFEPAGASMAKTWQGDFPHANRAPAGLERTAPVRSYPANGYGLYDMIGNVWEWTDDWYDPRRRNMAKEAKCCGGDWLRPATPEGSIDLRSGEPPVPRRTLKGGSHLCAPNYCQRYRPAARWPQPIDTTSSHVGFRCIVRR